jgi:hypothetical protein
MGEAFDAWPSLAPFQALAWVSRDILRNPNSAGLSIPEAAAYMAMISILAVPLAAFHRPHVYAVFLFVVAACAIMIAYGFEPLHTIVIHIPILRALKNFRMLVANFAVAGLSGLGISVLEEHVPSARKQRAIALALLGGMFVGTLELIHLLQLATRFKPEVIYRASFSRTLLILSLIVIAWRLFGGMRGWSFPIVACALVLFDVTTFAFGYMGFADRKEIFPPSPAFDFLHADKSQFRIIQLGYPYPANTPLIYGLDSADGYEIGFSNRERAFLSELIQPGADAVGINFVLDGLLRENDRRLDLLNVKYVVMPGFSANLKRVLESNRFTEVVDSKDIAIFQNPSVLPRAWVVPASGIEEFRQINMEVDRLKNHAFDPLKFATISQSAPFAVSTTKTTSTFDSAANIVDAGATWLTIRTRVSAPGFLIVSQTYYPGWKASVDGSNTDVVQADVTLTGVPIPAGMHEVRLVFRPLSFYIGLTLTIFSCVVLAIMISAGLRSQRQSAKRDAMRAEELGVTSFAPRS